MEESFLKKKKEFWSKFFISEIWTDWKALPKKWRKNYKVLKRKEKRIKKFSSPSSWNKIMHRLESSLWLFKERRIRLSPVKSLDLIENVLKKTNPVLKNLINSLICRKKNDVKTSRVVCQIFVEVYSTLNWAADG